MTKTAIRLPQLGEAVAEATIQEWLIAVGDSIEADADIAEVETEKSVLAITSQHTGVLVEIVKEAGSACEVGDLLAWLEVEGIVEETEQSEEIDTHQTSDPTEPKPMRAPTAPALAPAGSSAGFLSPRVRSMLAETGLREADLHLVRATGTDGRVTARDIERLQAHLDTYIAHDASSLRRAVSDSMSRAWERPLATVSSLVQMDPILKHRRSIPGRPSASIYALRALALALREDDRLVRIIAGDHIYEPKHMDIALAVDAEDGVLNPVIHKVDTQGLAELDESVNNVIEQARSRKLSPDAGEGGIATISNYGSLRITWATPVPPPGQSCLLGLGSVRRHPNWNAKTNSWDCVRACEITMTFDHRIADGAAAAHLLHAVVKYLEHPERLD